MNSHFQKKFTIKMDALLRLIREKKTFDYDMAFFHLLTRLSRTPLDHDYVWPKDRPLSTFDHDLLRAHQEIFQEKQDPVKLRRLLTGLTWQIKFIIELNSQTSLLELRKWPIVTFNDLPRKPWPLGFAWSTWSWCASIMHLKLNEVEYLVLSLSTSWPLVK